MENVFLFCLINIFSIAHNVFLLKGAYNPKNSNNLSKSKPIFSVFILNSTKQDFTFGAGLKDFAQTVFQYIIS